MDQTVLKIGAAGLLHDKGKFGDKVSLNVSEDYIKRHADLYQPFYKGRHTHAHAVYTAAFIEQCKDCLPDQFNQPGWGSGDALINLAAGHHRPETPMQWVVAMADRVSSGWDRTSFDPAYNLQLA
jgi:CRISPR-associated protein Csm1